MVYETNTKDIILLNIDLPNDREKTLFNNTYYYRTYVG